MNSINFFMNSTNFLEIGGGLIRHISPKFGKIGRICKPCLQVDHTPKIEVDMDD
jgi:hypothetical protein